MITPWKYPSSGHSSSDPPLSGSLTQALLPPSSSVRGSRPSEPFLLPLRTPPPPPRPPPPPPPPPPPAPSPPPEAVLPPQLPALPTSVLAHHSRALSLRCSWHRVYTRESWLSNSPFFGRLSRHPLNTSLIYCYPFFFTHVLHMFLQCSTVIVTKEFLTGHYKYWGHPWQQFILAVASTVCTWPRLTLNTSLSASTSVLPCWQLASPIDTTAR